MSPVNVTPSKVEIVKIYTGRQGKRPDSFVYVEAHVQDGGVTQLSIHGLELGRVVKTNVLRLSLLADIIEEAIKEIDAATWRTDPVRQYQKGM